MITVFTTLLKLFLFLLFMQHRSADHDHALAGALWHGRLGWPSFRCRAGRSRALLPDLRQANACPLRTQLIWKFECNIMWRQMTEYAVEFLVSPLAALFLID